MSTTNTILFISYDGLTDPLGQSQIIPYLVELTKLGYRFVVLSADKKDKLVLYESKINELLQPFPITWVSMPYHKNPPVLSSVYDYYQLRKTAIKLNKEFHFSHTHTRPGIPQLVALHLKKKYSVKYLNDIRGFWADERVDGGMWNLKNPLFKSVYNFFIRKENESLRLADYNTVLTYKAKEILAKGEHFEKANNVAVVPCSVDIDLFNPAAIDNDAKIASAKALGINSDDFVVSYLGSIGGWYLTKEMIQFCAKLWQQNNKAKFLFISNNRPKEVQAWASIYKIPRERVVVVFAQRHEVPLLLSHSKFSLFFIKPCFSKLSSSPTKHGEIMAMGIPVITNSGVGDVKEIVTKYDAGVVLEDFSEFSFQKAIEVILNPNIKADVSKIRQGAIEYYNLNNTVNTYHKVYQIIQNNKH